MDKLKMHTENKVDINIEKIGELFPNTLTEKIEGYDENNKPIIEKAIDFDILKQELSKVIVEGREERYQMNWPGKKEAILSANAPINKTLRPCREESINFDTTENLYIEGDNLEVLKLLQETYLNKVKMIYIDPPYNTGKDSFVYNDNFSMSSEEFSEASGHYDEEGNLNYDIRKNNESNGRFHTDWLNMMYPRLKLAKDLLSDDGVIFISIDDNEVDNLKKICNEIYGENNFTAQLTTVMNFKGNNDEFGFAGTHEYILVYMKNRSAVTDLNGISLTEEEKAEYKFSDDNGFYKKGATLMRTGEAGAREKRPKGFYPIYVSKDLKFLNVNRQSPDDYEVYPRTVSGADMSWRRSPEFLMKTKNEFIITKTNNGISFNKKQRLIDDMRHGKKAKTLFYKPEYSSGNGTSLIKKLFNGRIFDNPKPLELIKDLLSIGSVSVDCIRDSEKDESYNMNFDTPVILDFFSGSSTTAHAVMQLNAEDGGNRKFIMVQIPEETDEKSEARKAGYENICEIGKERIRRAGKKIKEENPDADKLDTGFRVLKLDSSNMKDVYYNPAEYNQGMIKMLESNIKEDRTNEDLLFQVMLDLGELLSSDIEEIDIQGKKVFNVSYGSIIACFDKNITNEVLTEIAKMQPLYAVFRDSSLSSDSVATNFEQIFNTYSPNTIRKVL